MVDGDALGDLGALKNPDCVEPLRDAIAKSGKKTRGAPTSDYHGVSAAPSKKNPWQARATNPVSLGGDGKYKSIGLFNTEREAAMAVDDYLYKTFPEKYAAFRANFPRNADGSRPDPVVGGPPPPLSIPAALRPAAHSVSTWARKASCSSAR